MKPENPKLTNKLEQKQQQQKKAEGITIPLFI